MKITKDITYLETSPKGFRLSGKTGSNAYDSNAKIRIGWFVAHIDNGSKEYIAVTNFGTGIDLGRFFIVLSHKS
jgi:beta-lactamase class D